MNLMALISIYHVFPKVIDDYSGYVNSKLCYYMDSQMSNRYISSGKGRGKIDFTAYKIDLNFTLSEGISSNQFLLQIDLNPMLKKSIFNFFHGTSLNLKFSHL